jgi:general secretion pathway protein M
MTSSFTALSQAFSGLSRRERIAIGCAVLLVGLAVGWLVLVAPALKVLARSNAEHRLLDQKVQQLQIMAQEAKLLRAASPMNTADAAAALQAAVKARLGTQSQITITGDRANLSLRGVSPEALSQWLAEARTGAQSKPTDARLTRSGKDWDGNLVMQLPTRDTP